VALGATTKGSGLISHMIENGVIKAPEPGNSIEPTSQLREVAQELFEMKEFIALDDKCVVYPFGPEPFVKGAPMPEVHKILVYDTKTQLFGIFHIQKQEIQADSLPPYSISNIVRPEASDCTQLSVVLTAMGAQEPEHELNPLYISYRKTIVAFIQEEATFDQGVREQLSLRLEDRSALLQAVGI
jgi:hypothetical protein